MELKEARRTELLNEQKNVLEAAEQLQKLGKEVGNSLNALNMEEESNRQENGKEAAISSMTAKQSRKWKNLSKSRKERLLEKELRRSKTTGLVSKETAGKAVGIKGEQELPKQGSMKLNEAGGQSTKAGAEAAKTEMTVEKAGTTAGVAVEKTGITAGKAGTKAAAGASTAGVSVASEAAVKAAKKFQESLTRRSAVQTEQIQSFQQSAQQLREEYQGKHSLSEVGKYIGGTVGLMVAPVLQVMNVAFMAVMSAMAAMLLPVILFLVFLTILVSILAFLLGAGASNSQSGGRAIVEVAKQELEISDANIGGYKYKSWYGMDADWCVMFVDWCADQCGYLEQGVLPKIASVRGMKAWLEEKGEYQTKESSYKPKEGDLVIFLNGMSHIGIVESYDADADIITTIEGNSGSSLASPYHKGSRVTENKYPRTSNSISGYGTPFYPEYVDNLEGDTNAEKIYRAFVSKGYSKAAAAGIVGNLYQEAGTTADGDINVKPEDGDCVGMAQWRGGRKQAFLEYCESVGQPWPDTGLEVQINYLLQELSGGQWIWSRISQEYGAECNLTMEEFKTLNDVNLATKVFCAKFERCHLWEAKISYRQQRAREILQKFN